MSDREDWDWELTDRAQDQFDRLDRPIQKQIVTKLDEVIINEWRTPPEYIEPLTNSPFDKLRVGEYRLGCRAIRKDQQLVVASIRKRSGAYTADD